MNLLIVDNVIENPAEYVGEILDKEFVDVSDGVNVFKNIQPRYEPDEFTSYVTELVGPMYDVSWNFVRKSPLGQEEPNFIHTDEMMGDITAILYLSVKHPDGDGTTIYNDDGSKSCVIYSKFNRMIVFDSRLPHSRNIFENFGNGDESRLIQVVFLTEKK